MSAEVNADQKISDLPTQPLLEQAENVGLGRHYRILRR